MVDVQYNQKLDKAIGMSTSSKIIENQIQTVKNSPRKSLNLTSSPQLTPRSRDQQSSSDCSSFDREQLLKLEIKQIKRENKFLKKKISDLVAELNGDKPKKKIANKGIEKQAKDITHASIDFFFEEINSLLNSLIDLFKIEFSRDEAEDFKARFPEQDYMEPTKKYAALKKFTINRKLQKIMLENDEKRYPMMLQTFTLYYKTKQECDKHIREVVDKLTTKAQSLSKIILDKAQKRSSLKNSTIKSQHGLSDSGTMIKVDNNTSYPWLFSRVGSTGSDAGEDPHKKRNQ